MVLAYWLVRESVCFTVVVFVSCNLGRVYSDRPDLPRKQQEVHLSVPFSLHAHVQLSTVAS